MRKLYTHCRRWWRSILWNPKTFFSGRQICGLSRCVEYRDLWSTSAIGGLGFSEIAGDKKGPESGLSGQLPRGPHGKGPPRKGAPSTSQDISPPGQLLTSQDISRPGQLPTSQDISPSGQLSTSQDISPPGQLLTSQDISRPGQLRTS